MATSLVSRSFPKSLTLASFLARSFSVSASVAQPRCSASSLSLIHRLRPLAGALSAAGRAYLPLSVRCLSTNATSSSLKDPNPNWSNRPPKETILLDGCDFEHWLIVMEPPEGEPTRDEIIDSYIKTLAMVVGSEQEARMKIYSVSTRCYFAFGALVPEELSHKIKELPKVRWVLPDSYLDVKNKDYGGEPFINGEAVPYDPKYHEEWIRNNARANERNRRNDRPRNFDKSRNFERRRENMQNRDFQRGPPGSPAGPPGANMGPPPPQGNFGGPPSPQGNFGGTPPPQGNFGGPPPPQGNFRGPPPPQGNFGGPPPQGNYGGPPPQGNMAGMPPQNSGGYAPNNYGPPPPNNWGPPPNSSYGGGAPPPPPGNMGGGPPAGNHGGMQQNNAGWSGQGSYVPGRDGGNYSG